MRELVTVCKLANALAAEPLAQLAFVGRGYLLEDNFLFSSRNRRSRVFHRRCIARRREKSMFLASECVPQPFAGPRHPRREAADRGSLLEKASPKAEDRRSMDELDTSLCLVPFQPDQLQQADLRDGESFPAALTISAGMIASVSGILILKVVPWPAVLCTSIVPPIFSMQALITSRPRSRPGVWATCSEVEKPGRKIN